MQNRDGGDGKTEPHEDLAGVIGVPNATPEAVVDEVSVVLGILAEAEFLVVGDGLEGETEEVNGKAGDVPGSHIRIVCSEEYMNGENLNKLCVSM